MCSCHEEFLVYMCLCLCSCVNIIYMVYVRFVQELEFNWRIVVATVMGFLGSGFGTVGGVGGGGIFVPMLTLIVGFDTKSAAALSKCNSPLLSHHISYSISLHVGTLKLLYATMTYA